jgi:hypothetical protein
MVEWRDQANEFQPEAGQFPKIVAVIENTRFWRTSCGTGVGYPLQIVLTSAGSSKPLMSVSCPVYIDHATCPLYDPASKTNTFRISKGAYELHLMYGDKTTPVKTFLFSVGP